MTEKKIDDSWTEKDWQSFDSWIRSVLQTSKEVVILFTKKDGTERKMKCTLMPELLPERTITETTRKQSTTNIAVYDLEAKGWRSFTLKSVKQVSLTL